MLGCWGVKFEIQVSARLLGMKFEVETVLGSWGVKF